MKMSEQQYQALMDEYADNMGEAMRDGNMVETDRWVERMEELHDSFYSEENSHS